MGRKENEERGRCIPYGLDIGSEREEIPQGLT